MKGQTKLRQVGFQEMEIADMVSSITKFSHMVTEPEKIKYYLDKALYLACSGRPGPVLLDLPLNVQHAEIDPKKLVGFTPDQEDCLRYRIMKLSARCVLWRKLSGQ